MGERISELEDGGKEVIQKTIHRTKKRDTGTRKPNAPESWRRDESGSEGFHHGR